MKKIYISVMLLLLSTFVVSCGVTMDGDTAAGNEIANNIESDGALEDICWHEGECYHAEVLPARIEIINGVWYLLMEDANLHKADNAPPTHGGGLLTFNNMQEFKKKLTTGSFTEVELTIMQRFPRDEIGITLCDPATLREVPNLPDRYEYKQIFIEWTGESYYNINYVCKNQNALALTVRDEENLRRDMQVMLKGLGTYEELQQNELILNLTRTTEKTEMGEMEVFLHDTAVVKNLKSTYIEFEYDDREYVITEAYLSGDGVTLAYSRIFVFDGDNSFMISSGNPLSYKEIVSLKLSHVE